MAASEQVQSTRSRAAARFTALAALVVSAIATLALAGWVWDVPALKSVFPGWVSMKPGTTLCLLCCAGALGSMRRKPSPVVLRAARALAGAVVVLAGLTLAEYMTGRDFGFDALGFSGPAPTASNPYPMRMSLATATGLLLGSGALVFFSLGHMWAAQLAAGGQGLVGLLTLTGYAYGFGPWTNFWPFSSVALHTAASLLLLSFGTLLARPREGLMQPFSGGSLGGAAARRVLPFCLLVPFVLGGLTLFAQQAGLVDAVTGACLLMVANVVVFAAVVHWTARSLNRLDDKRQESESETRRSRAIKAATFDAALDGIVTIDEHSRILEFNAAAERIFGHRRQDVIGKDMAELLIPPALREAHRVGLRRFLTTGEGAVIGRQISLPGLRADGTEFPVDLAITIGYAGDGTTFVGFVRDVSEREAARSARQVAEAETARTARDLARSNEDLQSFAYVASHDLQEPLRTLRSFTEILSKRYRGRLDADADEFLGYLTEAAERMQNMIRDLLEFSRVGTRGNAGERVDTAELVDRTIADLQAAAIESGAVVTRGPLPTVDADRSQLTQVFWNLLGNAIKYRRPDVAPRIHVAAERDGGEWRFSVADNGLGIGADHHDRVFVIFQRLHQRADYPGTGIGLAVTKRIVERHGGRIWLESTPGEGSTFYFTLPAS